MESGTAAHDGPEGTAAGEKCNLVVQRLGVAESTLHPHAELQNHTFFFFIVWVTCSLFEGQRC